MSEHATPQKQLSQSYCDLPPNQLQTIQEALGILESRLQCRDSLINSSEVKHFCQLEISQEPEEIFCCLFLDNPHRLIAFERLFQGTIASAVVYPRVVARRALALNAAAIIYAHNHPSGVFEPSEADIAITKRLRDALNLIEVRSLDHIIVGTEGAMSFADRGLM